MTKKLTLIIIICSIFSVGISQEDKSTKISIFKPGDTVNTVTKADDKKVTQENHMIKWNYTLLTRGVFLLNYEKSFHKYFSAEVGLGVTYRDFIFESYRGYPMYGDPNNAKFGFAVEGGVRLYPREFKDFEGFFVSPILSYRSYAVPGTNPNTTSTSSTIPAYSSSSFKQGYSMFDLQFKIGYAYESLWDWDLISEFYVGVAVRNATIRYYEEVYSATTGYSGAYTYVPTTAHVKIPQFIMGFKFGVPF